MVEINVYLLPKRNQKKGRNSTLKLKNKYSKQGVKVRSKIYRTKRFFSNKIQWNKKYSTENSLTPTDVENQQSYTWYILPAAKNKKIIAYQSIRSTV